MTKADVLRDAQRKRTILRFETRFEPGWLHGYVLAVGDKDFLIANISHELWLNGYDALRISDVRKLRADPYASFIEAALKARAQIPPRKAPVGGEGLEDWLLAANKKFPLVTIHLERVDPEVCHIGRIIGLDHGSLTLQPISPSAEWNDPPDKFRLKDITRVGFGGDYEAALALVAGEPSPVPR